MLSVSIIATAVLIVVAIIVPFFSNLKTPKNLHDWYFGNQALALWIVVGIGIIAVWSTYLILLFIH